MPRIALFAGGDLTELNRDFDIFVGVDRGAFYLLKQGLPLDLAVGDFDSVSDEELLRIKRMIRTWNWQFWLALSAIQMLI